MYVQLCANIRSILEVKIAYRCDGRGGHAPMAEKLLQKSAQDGVLSLATADAWETWLEAHHQSPEGVWLKIAKKGCRETTPTYGEALDVALCFGWIDGQKRPLNADFWLQCFTPRRARSVWSKVNTERVVALGAAGRLRAEGLRQIEQAKEDGRWDAAYAPQSTAEPSADFLEALQASPTAAAFFETLNKANRYAIYYRVESVKRPATRAARIGTFVAMLGRGETIHPMKKAKD
jgi:uncharacterized protein YdeI (YjbR/CyaY-like superfamily)